MSYSRNVALSAALLLFSYQAAAVELGFWATDGWSQFAAEDSCDSGCGNYQLGPGWGGQDFDAEYLYYKVSGTTLHLGLQTGFDVVDGHQTYGGKEYYAGDLALSFDGDSGTYEYGIDFGLYTKDYSSVNKSVLDATGRVNILPGDTDGVDLAGFYNVSSWNIGVYSGHTAANPFAIDGASGSLLALSSNTAGSSGVHYWRTVSVDLAGTGLDLSSVDAHWTMSCGNDAIDGDFSHSVPEPSLLSLLGFGLLGLGFVRRRKGSK